MPFSLDELKETNTHLSPKQLNSFIHYINKLNALPLDSNPKEIARYFENLGIRGRRYIPCECPVARYLRGNNSKVSVSVSTLCIFVEPDSKLALKIPKLPKALKNFIVDFDAGLYHSLTELS
jgi:hypothetical protein